MMMNESLDGHQRGGSEAVLTDKIAMSMAEERLL